MKTGFLFNPIFLKHNPGPGHPENPQRLSAIKRAFDSAFHSDLAEVYEGRPAEKAEITAVHSEEHFDSAFKICQKGGYHPAMESNLDRDSFQAALIADWPIAPPEISISSDEINQSMNGKTIDNKDS